MSEIWNKTHRKLVVELADEKFIHLWPRSTREISERDLKSPHLAGFISRGEVRILAEKEPLKAKKKKIEQQSKRKDTEKTSEAKIKVKEEAKELTEQEKGEKVKEGSKIIKKKGERKEQ